jgi:hypothetical protein
MIDAKVVPAALEDSVATTSEFVRASKNLFFLAFYILWMSYA